jgi:hypothetical protein
LLGDRKYRLTDVHINYRDRTLYRIQAVKSFGNVNKGSLGGYIESEDNLSHVGDCWVGESAKVCDYSYVSGKSLVYGEAQVYGRVHISESSKVFGYAKLYGNNVRTYGRVRIYGHAKICGGGTYTHESVWLCSNSQIYGNGEIYKGWVGGNSTIYGNAILNVDYSSLILDIDIDHGMWIKELHENNRRCLISNTLEKVEFKIG